MLVRWRRRTGSAAEAFFVDFHLLAFKSGRDATDEDNDVGISYLAEYFGGGGCHLAGDVKGEEGEPYLLDIVYLDGVALTCTYLQGELLVDDSVAVPLAEKCVAVEDDVQVVFTGDVEHDVGILAGTEDGLVAGREVLEVDPGCEGRVAPVVENDA